MRQPPVEGILSIDLGKSCPITHGISQVIVRLGGVGFPSTNIIPTTVLRQALAVPANGALARALGLLPPVNVCKSRDEYQCCFAHYLQLVHAF
jgi:hypothetical protein